MNKLGGIILGLLLLPSFVFAQIQTTPRASGFLHDSAQMLTSEQGQVIETNLSNFEKTTGNEIAVLTIPTLGDDNLERYAEQVFTDWGIGKKDKNNGVLLLIARDDRKMRIEVGYGLEGVLTDSQSGMIITNIMRPSFATGDYYKGIIDGVTAIETAVGGGEVSIPASRESEEIPLMIKILFFILFFFGSIMAHTRSIWLGGIVGIIAGGIAGWMTGGLLFVLLGIVGGGLLGLLFDLILSRVGFINTFFMSNGRGGSGGGFRGFGGGSSGGGGASGGW